VAFEPPDEYSRQGGFRSTVSENSGESGESSSDPGCLSGSISESVLHFPETNSPSV
jgi:hypothetical protein